MLLCKSRAWIITPQQHPKKKMCKINAVTSSLAKCHSTAPVEHCSCPTHFLFIYLLIFCLVQQSLTRYLATPSNNQLPPLKYDFYNVFVYIRLTFSSSFIFCKGFTFPWGFRFVLGMHSCAVLFVVYFKAILTRNIHINKSILNTWLWDMWFCFRKTTWTLRKRRLRVQAPRYITLLIKRRRESWAQLRLGAALRALSRNLDPVMAWKSRVWQHRRRSALWEHEKSLTNHSSPGDKLQHPCKYPVLVMPGISLKDTLSGPIPNRDGWKCGEKKVTCGRRDSANNTATNLWSRRWSDQDRSWFHDKGHVKLAPTQRWRRASPLARSSWFQSRLWDPRTPCAGIRRNQSNCWSAREWEGVMRDGSSTNMDRMLSLLRSANYDLQPREQRRQLLISLLSCRFAPHSIQSKSAVAMTTQLCYNKLWAMRVCLNA